MVKVCVPAVSGHAEGDPEDGSDHSDGTADAVVGNRPNVLAKKYFIEKCDILRIYIYILLNTHKYILDEAISLFKIINIYIFSQ